MQSAGKSHAHFKKVGGVLSDDRETWHTNTVLDGQYRKTRSFLIGRNLFQLRRRKVLESATPILKKSEGFYPTIAKLGIPTQF